MRIRLGHAALCVALATLAACNDTSGSDPSAASASSSGGSSQSAGTGTAAPATSAPVTSPSVASASAAVVQFSTSTFTVPVSSMTAVINVVKDGTAGGPVTVSYATVNESARAGADYVATSGSLTWAAGDSSAKSILVPITSAAAGKSFGVQLLAVSSGGQIGSASSATISVLQAQALSAGSSSSGSLSSTTGTSSSGTSSGSSGSSSGSKVLLSSVSSSSSSSSSSGSSSSSSGSAPKTIVSIQIAGSPQLVFNASTDKQASDDFPDAQVTAWKESDGTVDLVIPNVDVWRMRGSDLEHLTMDSSEIYSSTNSATQVTEDLHNYFHWMMGPYSTDGTNFYTLTHSEWYACLLATNCSAPVTGGSNALSNGLATTVDSLVSHDGGASWQLNTVNGSHTVADAAFTWTGTQEQAQQVYLHADNHTGIFGPSRVIKEGSYYYSIGAYLHRDFSQINIAAGIYQAPMDKAGYVILRTSDITNPNGWQAWTGGSNYQAVSSGNYAVYGPQINGITVGGSAAQIVFDTNAQSYIMIFTLYTTGSAVYYTTTKSLANPAWSAVQSIAGSDTLKSDPAGPLLGFYALNYPSIMDDASAGYNYEFTSSGSPQLFYNTSPISYGGNNGLRSIYRVPLTITYK